MSVRDVTESARGSECGGSGRSNVSQLLGGTSHHHIDNVLFLVLHEPVAAFAPLPTRALRNL
eukprot:234503-Rhodomonas_salina.1